jgi:integrase
MSSVPGTPRVEISRSQAQLKVIEGTVGARRIRFLTVIDVKRWHKNWRAPKQSGGKPRDKRAYDAVTTFRMVLRFGVALGFSDCKDLIERLSMLRFEKPGAREQQMTFAQVAAFIRKALELGDRDMAIGVAAQFDLLLRQKDIIGEWGPATPGVTGAVYASDEMWNGRFYWENIPGWMFRIKTSKTRSAIEFDLTKYTLLFPLLESVPHHERVGAIVKGEHGLPIRERTYRKRFRRTARAAGIPDEVWSMDSRAGGATEADEAGADFKAISDHLTHSDGRTTVRYIRRVARRTAAVADARAQQRKKTENMP